MVQMISCDITIATHYKKNFIKEKATKFNILTFHMHEIYSTTTNHECLINQIPNYLNFKWEKYFRSMNYIIEISFWRNHIPKSLKVYARGVCEDCFCCRLETNWNKIGIEKHISFDNKYMTFILRHASRIQELSMKNEKTKLYLCGSMSIERHKFRPFYVLKKKLNKCSTVHGGQTLRHQFNITIKYCMMCILGSKALHTHSSFGLFVTGSNVYELSSAMKIASHLTLFLSCTISFIRLNRSAYVQFISSPLLLNQQYWWSPLCPWLWVERWTTFGDVKPLFIEHCSAVQITIVGFLATRFLSTFNRHFFVIPKLI